MRKLALFIGLLFLASPSFAAWTAVGQFLSTSTKTGSDPFISTSTLALEALNFGICGAAVDNDGNGTDTDDWSVPTDANGEVWTNAGENEVDPGAANAGSAVLSSYKLKVNTLAAGATIGFDLAASKNSKAANCWEFTVYSGATITVMGTEQKEDAAASTDVGALTISGLSNTEHLCVRWTSVETGTSETFTPTAGGWVAFGDTGTTGGTDNTNQRISGEYIIATATSFTSDPTYSGGTFDRASTMRCFDETGGTPPAGGSRRIFSIQ